MSKKKHWTQLPENKDRVKALAIKASLARGDISGAQNPFYGKQHTEESIERQRRKKLGKKQSQEGIDKRVKTILAKGARDRCPTCGAPRNQNLKDPRCSRCNTVKKFGITAIEYNEMFDEQNGACKMCNRHQAELKKALCVDHNHTTGEIRGLLCDLCNTALGMLQDSSDLLLSGSLYLKGEL